MDELENNTEEKNEPIEETVQEEKTQEEAKNGKNKFSEEAENIKNETKDTVNKVKDTIKNTDFKKDANETTNFVKEMFFNPIEAVKRAANEEGVFGKAVILMIVFMGATVLGTIISLFKFWSLFSFGSKFFQFVISIWRPLITVLVPSIIILLFARENKKKLTTIISTVVVAYVPRIINSLLVILDLLIAKVTLVTAPLETVLSGISVILTYFGFKELLGKDDDSSVIKKYAIVFFASELILIILKEIGIY